jgi:hypothetical protein
MNKFLSLVLIVSVVAVGFCALSLTALADSSVKTLRMSDDMVAKVFISSKGTVLSFPAKPTKVILGRQGSFGLEYVESDIAVSPLFTGASSNLYVYLFGRRFSFDLVASPSGSSIIKVIDKSEPERTVKFHGGR